MRFAFTDDQLLFRGALKEYFAKEFPAAALRVAWLEDVSHSPERWAALADMGVVGLTVPERQGGMGLTEVDLVLLLEEAGRAASSEPLVETTAVAAPLLAECGHPDAGLWLESIARGERIVAVGVDDQLVLDADVADVILHLSHDRATLVDRADVRLERQPSVDGARHLFRRGRQKTGAVLAQGDEARNLRARAMDRGALGAAAQLVGLGDRMLAMTVDYAQERRQFGVPIGSFQAVKHHLADALLALEFARPTVYNAAYSIAHGLDTAARDVSLAKAMASEAAQLVARHALQCHGAIAYTVEYDLHMWMKRAWALAAAWGDAPTHRARLAERVLGARAAH